MDVPKNLLHPDLSFSSSSRRLQVPKGPQSAPVVGSEKQVSSTPYRYSAGRANIAAYKETHKVMDHLVVGEIKDACYLGLTKLEEVTLTNDSISFNPNDVFAQLNTIDQSICQSDTNATRHRWADWPVASSASDASISAEEALAKCINRIGQAVAKMLKLDDAPRKWSAEFRNTPVGNDRCKRKPDLALMIAEDAESTDTSQNWSKIFAVGELKSDVSSGRTIEQLAQYARLIFGEQPDRMHVLGFAVHQDRLYYAFFNRAGAFTSDKFDIHEHPERLIRVVVGMMFAGRETIGFDPMMKLTQFDETEAFEPYVNVGDNRYTIVELLHIESVIRGRATTVYKVKKPKQNENDKDEFLVVKNGWVDCNRKKENDILRDLEGIPYIPKVVAHQISETTTRTHFDEWHSRNAGSYLDAAGQEMRIEEREQVRVAITPVGTSIVDFRSRKELVRVFITIVDAIDELHKKNYLHRDISLRNVLINNSGETKNGLRDGLLIDFDYAIEDLSGRDMSGVHRTGTLPYMSVELLTAEPHQLLRHAFYHDLESLFYVMCYVCCICAGPNRKLRDNIDIFDTPIGKWFGKNNQTEAEVGEAKHGTVSPANDFEKNVLPVFDKYFELLKPLFRELSTIAVPPLGKAVSIYWTAMETIANIQKQGEDNKDDQEKDGQINDRPFIRDDKDLPFTFQPMKMRGREQLEKFRKILQEAFNKLPDSDENLQDADENSKASNSNEVATQSTALQMPTVETVLSPAKPTIVENFGNDEQLIRIVDLIPPENAPTLDGRGMNESQIGKEGDSDTLVGDNGEQTRPGKRKMRAVEEDEDDNSDEVESTYVRGTSPLPGCGTGKNHLILSRSSTRSRVSRVGTRDHTTKLASGAESPEDGLSMDFTGGKRRSGSRSSKRLRSRLEADGQRM